MNLINCKPYNDKFIDMRRIHMKKNTSDKLTNVKVHAKRK